MLPKLVLVIYLITGRAEVEVQYVVTFPTEEACQQAAAKYDKASNWAYPIRMATCVFDAATRK